MTNINLLSTTGSGFLESDFEQVKDALQDGGVDLLTFSLVGTGTITNSTTGTGLEIKQDGAGKGMYIDQNGAATALQINQDGDAGGIDLNKLSTGSSVALDVRNDGTGAGIAIDQNGNGVALSIDSEATTERVISIASESTTGVLYLDQNGDGRSIEIDTEATSQGGILLLGDAVRTGTGSASLMFLRHDNASSTGDVQTIQNDGSGNGLLIDQNGNGVALNIDSEATSNWALTINANANKAYVNLGGYNQNNGDNWFYRNVDSATSAGPVMFIEQDNSGDDQDALKIQQDGDGKGITIVNNGDANGILVDQNGNGEGIYITNSGTNDAMTIQNSNGGASLKLNSIGAGIEIKSPDGTIYCLTIANGGTVTVTAGGCTI